MSEDTTKEFNSVLVYLQAFRLEMKDRFERIELRLEAQEKRTMPLQTLLEELVSGLREVKEGMEQLKREVALMTLDVHKIAKDLSHLREHLSWAESDHEKRIRELEEATRKSS